MKGAVQHGPLKRKRDDSKKQKKSTETLQQQFFRTLRTVQRETRCTTKTLMTTIKAIRPFLKFECAPPSSFRGIDTDLRRHAHAISLELHGCVKCHKHVFLPSDKAKRCPLCRFPRFSASGKANEVSNKMPRHTQHKFNKNDMSHYSPSPGLLVLPIERSTSRDVGGAVIPRASSSRMEKRPL